MRIGQTILMIVFVVGMPIVARPQPTQRATERLLQAGKLIRVEANQLVIQPMWQPADADPVVVATDEQTRFVLDMDLSSSDELRPRMEVTARRNSPTQYEPNPPLIVHAWSPSSTGLLVEVQGAVLRLRRTPGGTEPESPVVQTDEETKIIRVGALIGDTWVEGGPIELGELQPGMLIKAMPPKGVAQKIFVWPARVKKAATSGPAAERRSDAR